jgi:dienelactone hydrolase
VALILAPGAGKAQDNARASVAVPKNDSGEPFLRVELRIPMRGAGTRGLEALLVRPNQPGRFPLVLISHGTPILPAQRREMTPLAFVPHAMEFARRGWAALIVMRRGYGDSAAEYSETAGTCARADYLKSARASSQDLHAAVRAMSRREDIDVGRILAVGTSGGGFASVAFGAEPVPGLAGVISFAGGRSALQSSPRCNEPRLIQAYRAFGKRSRVPMLWIYAENDRWFGPEFANQLRTAFTSAGGKLDFLMLSPFEQDGHAIFSPRGIPVWAPHLDEFLKKQKLAVREDLLPLPQPDVGLLQQMPKSHHRAFHDYLVHAPHKAFAMSAGGAYDWRSGRRTVEAAKADALAECAKRATDCRVVVVDEEVVR